MSTRHPDDEFPTARMNQDDLAQLRLLGRPSIAQLPLPADLLEIDLLKTIPMEVIPDGSTAAANSAATRVDLPRIRFTPPSFATSVPQRRRAPLFIGVGCALAALAGALVCFVL